MKRHFIDLPRVADQSLGSRGSMKKFVWTTVVAALVFGAAYWVTVNMAPECTAPSACPDPK
jgi:hypothetical protein